MLVCHQTMTVRGLSLSLPRANSKQQLQQPGVGSTMTTRCTRIEEQLSGGGIQGATALVIIIFNYQQQE